MLKQSPITPTKMSTREIDIDTERALTEPLIDAYYLVLKEVISSSGPFPYGQSLLLQRTALIAPTDFGRANALAATSGA
jgi:hypothetical protein